MRRQVLSREGTKTRNLNRRRAIRHHCLMCSDFRWAGVIHCGRKECILYPFRMGGLQACGLSPAERADAIKGYCTDCCYGDVGRRNLCDAEGCALFPYRNG